MPQENANTDPQALWDSVADERAAESGDELKQDAKTAAPEAPVVEEVEAPVGKTEAAAPAEAPKVETPQLSPELQARLARLDQLEAMAAKVPELTNQVNRAVGRIAQMQSEMDVARQAAKATGAGPSQAQIAAAKTAEKWESLKKDFPEWADATEQFVQAQLAGIKVPESPKAFDPTGLQKQIDAQVAQVRNETASAIEHAKVEGKYENWVEIVQGDDFQKWKAQQPADVQALGRSPKGRDAIRMLDLFTESQATPVAAVQENRAAKLAAAASKAPVGVTPTKGKSVADMTPAELWEYERTRANKRTEGIRY